MPRATPNDQVRKPDHSKMIQILDLDKHSSIDPHGLTETEIGEMCYFKLPMDFSGLLRFLRRVDITRPTQKSTTAETQAITLELTFPNGRRVWLKEDKKRQQLVISTQEDTDIEIETVAKYKLGEAK